MRDEGRPLGIGLQEQVSNHSKLLRRTACGGERWSKSSRQDLEQVSIRKTNESEPIEDASLQTLDVAETRGDELFWDKSVGSLMTGQTVTGVERA